MNFKNYVRKCKFMKMSSLLGERFKEHPSDTTLESHAFLLRGGYIRQVAGGIFSLLPPAKKISQKIENIIREEMNKIDGQEVIFPIVMPAELWKESGRFDSIGNELVRFKDRSGRDMVLGMTHEEAAVHLARGEAKSYLKYPFMIYQIQTKFRDEPRSRGGLIRVREFTMKDAYSFHTSWEDLKEYYEKVHTSYEKIYERVGLEHVVSVKSDTGMMGGNIAHEFMYLSNDGEDSLVMCDHCGYQSNMDVATSCIPYTPENTDTDIVEIYTENIKDIESLCKYLSITAISTIKAAVFIRKDNHKPVIAFLRGDLQVNEAKLKKVIGTGVLPLNNCDGMDLHFGFIGPHGLSGKDVEIVFDRSLKNCKNMVCGANKENYHLKGISVGRDFEVPEFYDIAKVNEGDLCPICHKPLTIRRGIEVGNIFQLGDKYTKSMNMTYIDENGTFQIPIMGCYGIGVGRLLACILEEHHDQYGPIWPKSVAPWQVHICVLNNSVSEVKSVGEKLYEILSKQYEVILDDRNVSAGMQFADADLLGVPIRIIVSKRNVANAQVEIVTRDKKYKKVITTDQVQNILKNLI